MEKVRENDDTSSQGSILSGFKYKKSSMASNSGSSSARRSRKVVGGIKKRDFTKKSEKSDTR